MMEKTNPFFSVIIPTHNGAKTIRKMLGSILMQTFEDYELIVVCDSCDDGTEKIAAEYGAKVICVDYLRDGLSRNAGLDAANGTWILFADDDDWYVNQDCFDKLAKQLDNYSGDVLDFGFTWETKGYHLSTKKVAHSMVWSRAWNRNFIGNNRFSNSEYGSDSAFFNEMIRDNPHVRMESYDELIYHYNYLREGSLTWMLNNKPSAQLDIVITHYNEPWEVGKKLFDSIQIQECVRMEHVNIILVQDGEDNALPWQELLSGYHFDVHVVTLKKHSGVAAARNAGLDCVVSKWVMFMDFDDMFADICSLSMITRMFPVNEDADIIWSKYIREVNDYGRFKDTTFNREDEHDYRMIGKMYRVQFLNDNNIRFIDDCPEYCDMLFNSVVFSETYAFRTYNFYAPFYPFYKKLRKDGAFSTISTLDDKVAHQFDRNVILVSEMAKRNKAPLYNTWLIRTVADAYHSIRSTELEPDENRGITPELVAFWKEYRDDYFNISPNDIEVVFDDSQTEAMTYIQEYYNYFDKEFYLQNDMISFDDFIKLLDEKAMIKDAPSEKTLTVLPKNTNEDSCYGKRAVVYCGTKETYVNMIASVKSLLATTPVDKVFFLIEDDVFPYDIPDIIETRNVKNTELFDPNGPNFSNVWTYMCLMRTAFPRMFPEYDKILSFDIDVVVTEDVSNLWDIDLTDYYFAGVPEEGRVKEIESDMYANFGVIMMNLKKLRDDGLADKLIDAVNTEHFGCPEQDAFNKYCRGHIYRLPNDYNVTVYSHITGEPLKERILHYAGLKYWKHFGPVQKYFRLEWPEIMKLQEALHE